MLVQFSGQGTNFAALRDRQAVLPVCGQRLSAQKSGAVGASDEKIETETKEVELVFVGGEDYFYTRLKNLVAENGIGNVVFAGFVPDYDLDALYRNALAYVRPSLHEGFELPALEAMSRGTPVVASDYACAREILGSSAYYFDGQNVESIASALRDIFKDEKLRQDLIEKGYAQAKKYSWKKMAEETLELYGKIRKR